MRAALFAENGHLPSFNAELEFTDAIPYFPLISTDLSRFVPFYHSRCRPWTTKKVFASVVAEIITAVHFCYDSSSYRWLYWSLVFDSTTLDHHPCSRYQQAHNWWWWWLRSRNINMPIMLLLATATESSYRIPMYATYRAKVRFHMSDLFPTCCSYLQHQKRADKTRPHWKWTAWEDIKVSKKKFFFELLMVFEVQTP